MIDSKKSAGSASEVKVQRTEALKSYNPYNAVPNRTSGRCERYLYGGMLFPSRILSAQDPQMAECEIK